MKEGDIIDGRFTLIHALGEGGFGIVWLARQTEPVVRDVAIKLLRGSVDSEQVVDRFEAERQTLARMEHPCIARVFDAGTTEAGLPYFAMEYVDGKPITQYCAAQGLSLNAKLALLREVCLAVQHAHQKGVIHRDLKPGNILVGIVDGRPVPKVIDFGIAKAVTDDGKDAVKPSLTLEAQVIGTPQYMSPEQATIGPKNVDTRSDVYSLGTVMYELITGSPPFDPNELRRAGLEQICRIVRERMPMKPSTRLVALPDDAEPRSSPSTRIEAHRLRRQVAGEVDWIVMKALEKEPARRYQTAEGLAADIARFLHHEPVQAGPPSRLYTVRKFIRRRRLEVAAAAVVALALVAVAAVSTYQKQQARASEQRADESRAQAVRAAENERAAKNSARQNELLAMKRADDAARELSKANAIAEFAQTMLSGLGPSVSRGRDTKLIKDLLEIATRNTDQRLAMYPELDLIVRGMIGRAHFDLGDYQKAIDSLKPRFDSTRGTPAQDTNDRLANGLLLGTLYDQIGETGLAASTFREVADAYDRLNDTTSANAMQARSGLAKVLSEENKLNEALALYQKAYRRLIELKRSETEPAFQIRNSMAATLARMKRMNDALQEWEDLLTLERRVLGEHHLATIAVMTNLAYIYNELGQLDKAISYNMQVVAAGRVVYEPMHPMRIPAMNNLIAALTTAKRFDEARNVLSEATQIVLHNGSSVGWKNSSSIYNQAMLLARAQGKLDEAVACAMKLRDVYIGEFGHDDFHTIAGEAAVLGALADAGRYEEALERAQAITKQTWPSNLPKEYQMALHAALADVHLGLGHRDAARQEMEFAKTFADRRDDKTLDVQKRLQRVMQALGDPDAALLPATAPATTSPTTMTAIR